MNMFMKITNYCWLITLLINFNAAATLNIDSCDYYEQLDSKLSCGPSYYIQEFAIPYCNTYLASHNKFSAKGQIILRDIRQCLQNVLLKSEADLTCENIEAIGFASHEYCYLMEGFCELSTTDLVRVLWIARNDLLNPHIWSMINNIDTICLVKHLK